MAIPLLLATLAVAGHTGAQATRGFPDCINGPLKNNTVCDTTAGMNTQHWQNLATDQDHRSFGTSHSTDSTLHPRREAKQHG